MSYSVDSVSYSTISKVLDEVAHGNYESVYDFVSSPFLDTFSSSEEKHSIGFCLFDTAMKVRLDREMYAQVANVAVKPGSPSVSFACLLRVWANGARVASPQTLPRQSHENAVSTTADGEPAKGLVQKSLELLKSMQRPSEETKEEKRKSELDISRVAALKDTFLHVLMYHRLEALIDGVQLLEQTLSINSKESVGANEVESLLKILGNLEFVEFKQFWLMSPRFLPHMFSLVANELRTNLFVVLATSVKSGATLLRLGHGSRGFFAKSISRRRNVLCIPICFEVQSKEVVQALVEKRRFRHEKPITLHFAIYG